MKKLSVIIAALLLAITVSICLGCAQKKCSVKKQRKSSNVIPFGFAQTPKSLMAGDLTISNDIVYDSSIPKPLSLDVYYFTKVRPTVLYIHGGGWVEYSINKSSRLDAIRLFVENGWNVVSIDYRMANNTLDEYVNLEMIISDCLTALNWIALNADTYNFDKNYIITAGESAGGHLALMTGLRANNSPDSNIHVAGVINMFGVTDVGLIFSDIINNAKEESQRLHNIEYKNRVLGDSANQEEVMQKCSPINHVSKTAPIVYTLHGDSDGMVSITHAYLLHNRLDSVGVKNELVVMPGMAHGIDSFSRFNALFNFFEKELSL
jgi:acetyl esterase/lipase